MPLGCRPLVITLQQKQPQWAAAHYPLAVT